MSKVKGLKKVASFIAAFVLVAGLLPVGSLTAHGEEEGTPSNPMLHFTMRIRWGNVIGDPENSEETNFDGSVSVSENARVSLQRTLLFEEHNENADKITSEKDPVSWNSLIYGHWDGVKVTISSPANDNVTITTTQGSITKTAQEFYDLGEEYVEDVGEGREIVVDVYPAKKNPVYFLKVFWGKVDRTGYAGKRCSPDTEGTVRCHLPVLNADGSFKIDSAGTIKLIKPLRFEWTDKIDSKTDSEIKWTSRIYGGVDGILVRLKLNADELDRSDTVTLNFTNAQENFPRSYSIVDLYHDKYTEDNIKEGYGVVLQVWRRPNRTLIRVKDKPTVYMVEDDVKRPIPSPEVLASQGMTFDDVEIVDQEEADTYADGDPLNYADGTIVQEEGRPEVYVIENGEKKHIEDPQAFVALGYKWSNIVKVKPGILTLYRNSSPLRANSIHPEGALIRVAGSPTVYVIRGGRKVPISSIKLFNAYRFDWNKVLVVSRAQANRYKIGRPLKYPDGSLIRDRHGRVYKIDQGKRRWVRSINDFRKAGYKESEVIDVDDSEVNALDEGIDIVTDDITE